MKKYNKILEAVHRGINLALDDFDSEELVGQLTETIKDKNRTKEYLTLMDYVVDLELPSGTLWCKYNLGCDWKKLSNKQLHSKALDWYGDYYAWGEIEPNKPKYDWKHYKFKKELIKYNKKDKLTELLPEDDAAYQHDNRFKIPTKELFNELLKYTTNELIENYLKIKGLNGRLFTSKTNKNQLFIPASGYYDGESLYYVGSGCYLLSSSLSLVYSNNAYYLYFDSDRIYIDYDYRCRGFTIRPVLNYEIL